MTVPVFASFALLQAAPAAGISQMIFMYGAIFAIFYFVLIRPQQKQRKTHEERVKALKKGDEIVTAGGIVGEVVHIAAQGKDGAASLNDRITIKSGESRLVVERGRIAAIGGTAGTAAPNA
jgi:preprotein translocase subunit YajC